MPIRILTVDDHALLRKGIRLLVSTESDMQLVAEASTGREAVQGFRTHRPDVTLMDLQMPDMGGVEAIIAIRGEFPNARIIVLTTYAGDAQVLRALNAGALDDDVMERVQRHARLTPQTILALACHRCNLRKGPNLNNRHRS